MLVYVRPYRLHLVLAAICLVSISLLGLAMPWAVKDLVDQVVVGQDIDRLNHIALLLAGIFILRAGLSFAQTYLIAWAGERVVATL
ncbi:MAG: ABC transporter transmembrane domain-containing protein, partial [Anaerolineae bacterium]